MERSRIRTRRLAIALGLNIVVAASQVVGGLFAHSTGLLADAGHNVTDAAGIAVSLAAVRFALRPRDPQRTFGYHRSTILAAIANAAIIGTVTVAIVIGSIDRLLHPHDVHGAVMVAVAAAGMALNALSTWVLFERSGHQGTTRDLNMWSAAFHMAGDAAASLAVLVAGAVVLADRSLSWVDPLSSLFVAVLILFGAYRIVRASVEVLLEAAPADVDLQALLVGMGSVPGVTEVHDLHVWSLSSEVRAMSAHVVLSGHPTLEEAQAIGEKVKSALVVPWGISHATLELECERCEEGEADPCLMDSAAESRSSPAGR
jgi:cobalt-zinc-cadmium efflux system protein